MRSQSIKSKPPSPKRILVVDDNQPSALTLTWAMEMYGFDVRTCFDGQSAIDLARDFRPEVVLLDLGMPVMSGFEVCRQFRMDRSMDRTKVMAQTGWGDVETRRLTAEAGFNHHLTKPIDLEALLSLINADADAKH